MIEQYAVNVENLTMRFGTFTAVNNLSFHIAKGEIFGLLGANGAGKTTAIRMLCGLLKPSSGEASVAGYSVNTERPKIKQSIGYMSQKFSLYEDLTVSENIEFYGGIYGLPRESIEEKREQLLRELNLLDRRDTLTSALPLGWKQRLALSTALLHDPQVIFLDEPTGGVDPVSRRNFWRLIYEIAEAGKTIFVTTHYMDEAEYCNRLSIMYQGKIIEIGTPGEVKTRHGLPSLQDVFISLVDK
jgi:drug efflux transport system ATP-binding protein